jgi:phosphoglycolate phosphatase
MFKLLFFLKKGRSEFKQRIREVELFPEVKDVLTTLKKASFQLGIVSSDSRENILVFLAQNQLTDYFDFIHTELNLFGKGKVLKKVLCRYQLNPSKTIYLGDEVRDIEAARVAKIKVVSVTWGFNSEKLLRRYQPDYLINQPKEILDIIKK